MCGGGLNLEGEGRGEGVVLFDWLVGWGVCLPFHLDHLLRPVRDVEIALLVGVPDVSGPEEAIRREGALDRREAVRVPLHDVGPAEDELAETSILKSLK